MKAMILNSGGVDSTTCVALAISELGKENVSTVSIRYGQRHENELGYADKIAKHYDIDHYVLDLGEVLKYSDCPLLASSTKEIQHKPYSEQLSEVGVPTYVPFRNGLFLSAIASLAMSVYPDDHVNIYLGNHADDSEGNAYADCSLEFIDAIGKAINVGTYGRISVVSPFVNARKADIVKKGLELGVPYELTWSCYEGREKACGKCASCLTRLEAFRKNGVEDPLGYE